MGHARRFIAILVGAATWCMVATTVAHAAMLPDPVPVASDVIVPSSGAAVGTPFWENAATTVLGVLLVLALTGLVFALRRPRKPEPSQRSEPELHA
jgi:hypothetical protein